MDKFLTKELRDALRWAPLGAGLLTILLVNLFHTHNYFNPLSKDVIISSWFACAVFASLLSIATFWKDASGSGRAFLIHRGLSPSRIFNIRVITGLMVYLVSMLLPLVGAAAYLSFVGPMRAPVRPIQVLPSVPVVFYGMAFYFAGVLVSCRPSRWFGSKLLPLVTALPVSYAAMEFSELNWVHILISQSLGLFGMACLFFASRFAFVHSPSELSPSRQPSQSFSLRATLVVACAIGVPAITIFSVMFFQPSEMKALVIEFTATGDPWLVSQFGPTYPYEPGQSNPLRRVREQIAMTASNSGSNALEFGRPSNSSIPLRVGRLIKPITSNRWAGSSRLDMTYLYANGNRRYFSDPTGYILVYDLFPDQTMQLQWVVGADLVTRPSEMRGAPLPSTPSYISVWEGLRKWEKRTQMPFDFAAKEAIYQVDFETGSIQTLIPGPIDFISADTMLTTSTSDPEMPVQQMFIISGHELVLYEMSALQTNPEEQSAALSDKPEIASRVNLSIREAFRTSMGDSKLPKINGSAWLQFIDPKNWTLVMPTMPFTDHDFVIRRSEQSQLSEVTFKTPSRMRVGNGRIESAVGMSSAPPIYMGPACLIFVLYALPYINPNDYILLLSQIVGSGLLCFVAARFRGLTTAGQLKWSVVGCLFGLGTCLGILAIYPKPISVECFKCRQKRRVENDGCEHCGAGWQGLQFDRISIREESVSQTVSSAIAT